MKNRLVSAQWIIPVLILFLAFTLRFYHLGDKGLWGDEIAQARWALFPLEKMWERFRDPPDFILHFLFGQFALQFGDDAFWIRLPSLVTSLLAVPATYVAARRVGSRAVAFAAMLLMALSPFQIWYAQDARMYASLVCFATLSLYFFLRLLDKPQWRSVLGLTLTNAAAMYTHLFGVFPAVIEFVALCGIAAADFWQARARADRAFYWRKHIPRRYELIVAGLVLAGVLALPLVPGTLPYVASPTLNGIEAAYGDQVFQLSPQFLQLLLSDMGLVPDMGWRMGLSLALALFGFVVLARKKLRDAWVLGAWVLFPLLVLQATQPSHTVANRYLIFLQPVYLILISHSLYAIVRGADRMLQRVSSWRAQSETRRFIFGASVVASVLVLCSVAPLRALYARAKLNDWQTLARFFETRATSGDVLMVEQDFWGMNTLAYYMNPNRFSSPPATMAELQNALAQDRTLWYMSFGGYLNPQQEAWVKNNLQRVDDAAWMRPDLDYVPRDEFHFTQSEPLLEMYTRQGKTPSEILYANELGDRARATPHLPVKPNSSLVAQLARKGGGAQVLRMEYVMQPGSDFAVLVNKASLAPERIVERQGRVSVEYDLSGNLPDEVEIEIKNLGVKPLLVKRIALEAKQ